MIFVECLPAQSAGQVTRREGTTAPRPLVIELYALLALLPTLFIAVSGRVEAEAGPVAFRFTAMADDSPIRKILRLVCSLLMMYLISTRLKRVIEACSRAKLILLFPVLGFCSILWSQNRSHTLVDAANLLLTTGFAIYLYVRYRGDRLTSFVGLATFVSLMLSAIAVVAFPSVGIDAYQQNAWRGIFGQRNNCAAVCSLFLVVALHWEARGVSERLMRGTSIFLSLIFIVMSGSRTGWILAALAFVLTYALRFAARLKSFDRVAALMIASVAILGAGLYLSAHFNQVLGLMDKDPTMTQRTIIWAQVLPSIAKQPVTGFGYSSFWMGLNGESTQTVLTTGWMAGQAQDGYLDVLLQLGLIGLVPLCFLLLRGLLQAARAINRRLAGAQVLMATVLILLILIENIGESSFLLPLGIPWFYTILSLLVLGGARRPSGHGELGVECLA